MPPLKPDKDKNFGGSLVWDFRQWWRHVKTIYWFTPSERLFIPVSMFYTQSVILSLRFIPQSVFYTQSAVRSPQSAVRSPQSTFGGELAMGPNRYKPKFNTDQFSGQSSRSVLSVSFSVRYS